MVVIDRFHCISLLSYNSFGSITYFFIPTHLTLQVFRPIYGPMKLYECVIGSTFRRVQVLFLVERRNWINNRGANECGHGLALVYLCKQYLLYKWSVVSVHTFGGYNPNLYLHWYLCVCAMQSTDPLITSRSITMVVMAHWPICSGDHVAQLYPTEHRLHNAQGPTYHFVIEIPLVVSTRDDKKT